MLADLIKDLSRIHTRDIRMSTFPHDNSQVIVTGELIDTRYIRIFDITGKVLEPGTIHHIRLFCRIADPFAHHGGVCGHARHSHGRMPHHPGPGPAFNRAGDQTRIHPQGHRNHGGTNGCTHLATLTKAMAQEIVHGWLTENAGTPPRCRTISKISRKRISGDSLPHVEKRRPEN